MNRMTALIAASALFAAPLATILAASPATAATTKRGVCGSGTYEFQVDREDREDGGGFEVSADLDRLAPGSRWTVVIEHDGNRVRKVTRTADNEGELDVDVTRSNTRGTDTFRFKAVRAGGGSKCAAAITAS
jgi:opacity protein-like surface antigen